jgi:hypothetical protein
MDTTSAPTDPTKQEKSIFVVQGRAGQGRAVVIEFKHVYDPKRGKRK